LRPANHERDDLSFELHFAADLAGLRGGVAVESWGSRPQAWGSLPRRPRRVKIASWTASHFGARIHERGGRPTKWWWWLAAADEGSRPTSVADLFPRSTRGCACA